MFDRNCLCHFGKRALRKIFRVWASCSVGGVVLSRPAERTRLYNFGSGYNEERFFKKLFLIWGKWFCRRSRIKVFLVLAVVAILFSGFLGISMLSYFKCGSAVQEDMSFQDCSLFSPGDHLFCAEICLYIFEEDVIGNIHVELF